jgi:hypothetical protein
MAEAFFESMGGRSLQLAERVFGGERIAFLLVFRVLMGLRGPVFRGLCAGLRSNRNSSLFAAFSRITHSVLPRGNLCDNHRSA